MCQSNKDIGSCGPVILSVYGILKWPACWGVLFVLVRKKPTAGQALAGLHGVWQGKHDEG